MASHVRLARALQTDRKANGRRQRGQGLKIAIGARAQAAKRFRAQTRRRRPFALGQAASTCAVPQLLEQVVKVGLHGSIIT